MKSGCNNGDEVSCEMVQVSHKLDFLLKKTGICRREKQTLLQCLLKLGGHSGNTVFSVKIVPSKLLMYFQTAHSYFLSWHQN